MNDAIGAVIPTAVGVLASPLPIIALILTLLSPRGRQASIGLVAGWVLGVAAVVSIVTALSSLLPESDPDGPQPIQGWIQLAAGALLLVLGVLQWRKRRRRDDDREPEVPGWMKAIDRARMPVALGAGFVLGAINPKNTVLGASAGVTIGEPGLGFWPIVLVIVVYTLVATCAVIVIAIAYLLAGDRLPGPLDALRAWLTRENAVLMTVVLLVVGASMIGDGIAAS